MKYTTMCLCVLILMVGCDKGWLTSDRGNVKTAHVNTRVDTMCLEGHVYYILDRYSYGQALAPKLQDDGRPCKCKCEMPLTDAQVWDSLRTADSLNGRRVSSKEWQELRVRYDSLWRAKYKEKYRAIDSLFPRQIGVTHENENQNRA